MEPRYIGDGVYASFDGYHIWLHLGAHDNPGIVALELEVFEALSLYAKKVWADDLGAKK